MSLTPPFLLLDRYDVSAEIGRGGHAIVYRAHDRVFDRAVAIKLLRDDALSPDVLARFRQEIQLTARLEHAHILHVYDTGTFEGLPYVVMELASGQTLADRLAREGQLPIADALQIARDVGLALAHAHARGIVHRDVKPENILLGSGGAMLADFGVARVTADQAVQRITSTGMAVGTLQYMSPEQLCAEPIVDERSDQYALACVLYEMLAGVRPHMSASLEGLRMLRLTGQHAPVSAHRPSVSAEVQDALQVAMAVAPADRFRSVEAFLGALGAVQTGDMAVPRMPSGASRSGARSGRGMTPVAAGPAVAPVSAGRRWAVGLGLVGVVAAAVMWQGARSVAGTGAALSGLEAGTLTVSLAPVRKDADSLDVALRTKLLEELAAWPGVSVKDEVSSRGLRLAPLATAVGGEVQLRLDVRSDSATAWRIVRGAPVRTAEWPPVIASMVREAISGRPANEVPGLELLAARSLPALRAYARGFAILRETGALDSATQSFRAARDAVPSFAPAYFWAAQSASWAVPTKTDVWRTDADEAVRLGALRGVDSLLALGLQRLSTQDFPEACAAYLAAVERDPRSFVGWYGLGQCQYDDQRLVESDGKLRFRSSHWGAASAYRRSVEFVETSMWLAAVFPRIRRASYSGGSEARLGMDSSGTRSYLAQPSLINDTMAFDPIAAERFGDPSMVPSTWRAAVRRGQRLGVDITTRWVRRFPDAAQAWLEHALSLELAGRFDPRDPSGAVTALNNIDTLGLTPQLLARHGVAYTRLALRRRDTTQAFSLARRTLSAISRPAREASSILLPLAVLLNDRTKVTALLVPDSAMYASLPAVVADTLQAFQTATMLGDCRDLKRLRDALHRVIDASIAKTELATQRNTWLRLPFRAAVPCLGPSVYLGMPSEGPLDRAIHALAKGDSGEARTILSEARQRLRGATSASITWDYQFVEAAVLVQAGDSSRALRQLTDAFTDLGSMSLSTLQDPNETAGLHHGLRLLQLLQKQRDVSSPRGAQTTK